MNGKTPTTTAALVILFAVTTPSTLFAETASTLTNTITLDTRGDGDLTVTGRVLDGQTRAALPGAAVSLAGSTATSGSNGTFTLANVDLGAGSTLTASGTGFLPQTRTVTAAAGARAVNVGDILLGVSTGKPVVEFFRPDLEGFFLSGFGMQFTGNAGINWNGHPPGDVTFFANGTEVATRTGSGPNYQADYRLDDWFSPSLTPGANTISVVATSAGSEASERFSLPLYIMPVPQALDSYSLSSGPVSIDDKGKLSIELSFPDPESPIGKSQSLPIIGDLGGKLQAVGSFDYTVPSGQWELGIGGNSKFGVEIGPLDSLGASINASGSGTATASTGVRLENVALGAGLSLSGKFQLLVISPLDVVGPGASQALAYVPGLNNAIKAVSVIVYLKPAIEGDARFDLYPEFGFAGAELTGKLGLEAAYEPDFKIAKVRIYVGGEPRITFQFPGDFFKEVGFRAYAGLEASVWTWSYETEYVFVDYSYPSPANRLPLTGVHPVEGGYMLAAADNAPGFRPMDRPWRDEGPETFLQTADSDPARRLAADEGDDLETFVRMGNAVSPGAVHIPATGPGRRIQSDPELPAGADLPLLANVFPESAPALAADGDDLMLLYVRDTGAADPIQFTEIAWTRFDGAAWTTPAAIETDSRGQFAPSLAVDGEGRYVAVWERFRDAAVSGTDLEETAAQMEIVTARWDPVAGSWSAVTALTDNTVVDHKPKIAGPLSDGDLILTWRRNPENLLMGAGPVGDPGNTTILTRRWDSATGTWGAEEILVDEVVHESSDSLAAAGNQAVYLLCRDMDGDLDDPSDGELFYRSWDEAGASWGALTRYTDDAVHDRSALVEIDDAGGIYTVWQRGSELVMDRDLAGAPSTVRSDAGGAGFADFALTVGPAGNVVVVWQEMTEFGSDAHYRVYDPASSTWGLDTVLSQDSDLERSFAPAWDPMGNLVLAYDNVTVTGESVTVALEGGDEITVDGVPQPGAVDLRLAKRALVKDLSFAADSLTAEGTDFLPGDGITLRAGLLNSGNVAEKDVVVSFYDGDPENGGTLIEAVTVPGWLKASEEREVAVTWTIPEPAVARTIFAVVDAAGTVTEFDDGNNVLSLGLNGVDLELEYVSGSVLPDGSMRVVSRIRNLGAPASPVSTLRLVSEADSPLAEIEVSRLAPGDSVEMPVDLPAGSHPEGDESYRLVVDEDGLAGDIDYSNNEALFSLNLWIDEDGDGIPRYWELANGMSDDDPDDADLDVDGDGFSAKDEYLAGTDPRDAASVLKIGEIARQTTPDGTSTLVSWASVADRRYRVERSYDLSDWTVLEDDVEATPPLNTVLDPGVPPTGRAFYRLSVK